MSSFSSDFSSSFNVVEDEKPLLIPFPNPRMGMPELLVPGRKPVGEVEIDWGHPLSKGLTCDIDFVHGKERVNNLELNLQGNAKFQQGSLVIKANGDALTMQSPFIVDGSVEIIFNSTQNGSARYLFDTQYSRDLLAIESDNQLLSYWNGSSRGSTSNSLSAGGDTHLIYNHGTNEVFINGVLFHNYNDYSGLGGYKIWLGSRYSYNSHLNGSISLFRIYNENLNISKIKSLHADPYQFLKPKTPAFFPVPRRELEEDRLWLEPKMSMPELLVPKKQPVDIVEINKKCPLYKGLKRYYPMRNNLDRELVSNSKYLPENETHGRIKEGYKCTYFDGSGDRIAISGLGVTNGDFTMSVWFNIPSSRVAEYSKGMFVGNNHLTYEGNSIFHQRATGYVGFYCIPQVATDTKTIIYENVPNLDVGWHHFVVVRKGNVLSGYLDGIDRSYSTSDQLTSDDTFIPNAIGQRKNKYFLGDMRDMVTWEVALTGSEVKSLFNDPYQLLKPKSAPILIDSGNSFKDGFFLPDDKMLQPEMLQPNRKPVGDVEIDWTHPLAKDIAGCFVSGQGLRNLATGRELLPYKTTLPTYNHGVYSFNDNQVYDIVGPPNTHNWTVFTRAKNTSGLALIVGATGTSISDYGRDVSILYGTSYISGRCLGAGNYDIRVDDNNVLYDKDKFVDGMLTTENGTHHRFYKDGVFVESQDKDITGGKYITEMDAFVVGGTIEADGGGISFNGDIETIMYWKRPLTDGEAKSLSDDPYQFLKPKSTPKYIPPSDHGFNLPDSRMEMPELYMPGRKPTGKVKIDWEHPLAKGLTHCFLMNEYGYLENKATNGYSGGFWGNTSAETIVTTNKGRAYHQDGATGASFILDTDFQFTHSDKHFTVSTEYKADTGTNGMDHALFDKEDDAGFAQDLLLWLDHSGGDLRLMAYSGSGTTPVSIGALYDWHSYSMRTGLTSSNYVDLFLDGTEVQTNKNLNTIANTGSYRISTLGNEGDAKIGTGSQTYFYIHNRKLSDGEMKSLSEDPYQFLIPE